MARSDGGCDSCGATLPADARFCMSCGAPTGSVSIEVRKTVTALFCDVVGSTELAGSRDLEVHRREMEQWFTVVSAVVARHGGTVEKYAGDAVLAVFGVPASHEDDALRACRTALDVLATSTLATRVGLETGEVVVADLARGSTFVSGPPVNLAARLQSAAAPGQALVGPACHRLVRDLAVTEELEPLDLKGVGGPVPARRLLALSLPTEPAARGSLLGREREMGLLHHMLERAVHDRTCQVVTVVGVAGLGKTRLAAEFLALAAPRVRVLRGRCLPYGDGVTWWPLVDVVRQVAGLTGGEQAEDARRTLAVALPGAPDADDVADRLAAVVGLGGAVRDHRDVAWALRRMLEELGRQRPVVLALDDLHWAEAGMLAVLDDALTRLHGPVLVLLGTRPDLLEAHRTWGSGRSNSLTFRLEPLTLGDVGRLADATASAGLEPDAAARIAEVSGGNPLFVEQLVRMLLDDGSLVAGPGGRRLARAELDVPPTVAALISSRLDRLDRAEREVLGAAAVVGQVFYPEAVAALVPDVPVDDVLTTLLDKGLVRPTVSDLPGRAAYAFDHVLVRDAAYAAMPKALRADLHEAVALWLKGAAAGVAYDGFVGGHLEAACLLMDELEVDDERAARLHDEASQRLEAAGREVWMTDRARAADLLGRADRLRDDQTPSRWALRLELAHALRFDDRLREALDVAESVEAAAVSRGDHDWSLSAALVAGSVRPADAPGGGMDAQASRAERAVRRFTRSGDDWALMRAHLALAEVANGRGRTEEWLRQGLLASDAAERAGHHRMAVYVRSSSCVSPTVLGLTPLSRALARFSAWEEDAVTLYDRARLAIGTAACHALMGADGMPDRWEQAAAQESLAEDRRFSRADWYRATTGLLLGEFALAERVFRDCVEIGEQTGELGAAGTDAACLAIALLHQGRDAEGVEAAHRALQLGERGDVVLGSLAHVALAWGAALARDPDRARALLNTAESNVSDEALLNLVMLNAAAAEVTSLLGDSVGSGARWRTALQLCAAKEATAAEAWCRSRADLRHLVARA